MLALAHTHTPTGYVCSVSPVCTNLLINMRWGGHRRLQYPDIFVCSCE